MKLRNKNSGNVGELFVTEVFFRVRTEYGFVDYETLSKLNEEWEDCDESKDSALDLMILTLINFIENEPDEDKVDLEDCKQMLVKLKAWKRLRDKGFKFDGIAGIVNEIYFKANEQYTHIMVDEYTSDKTEKEYIDDLMLLFGGEE